MMKTMTCKNHNPLTKALLTAAVLLSLLFSGCERKDLWLPSQQATVDLAIYDIDLELYFGFNWKAEWKYEWDDSLYGSLGYTEPYGVQATIYTLDGMHGARRDPFTKHMVTDGRNRVSLVAASWYDMLFYNYDTEYVQVSWDNLYSYYNMTTRAVNAPSYFPSTRDDDDQEVLPDTFKTYRTYNQPDEIFGVFVEDLYVSEDPEDYEEYIDENGSHIFLYRINATMEPYTFIYLIQPVIINNYVDADDPKNPTSEPRIKAINGLSITGLSQGVELYSRKDWDNAISITTEDVKPMQTHKMVTLSDGTEVEADVCAARVLTWGLPGINPIEARRVLDETGVAPVSEDGNFIGLNLVYRGGTVVPKPFNITQQIANHPTGGVITIVIDASKLDRDVIDKKNGGTSGGGFSATVENWENEINSEITI